MAAADLIVPRFFKHTKPNIGASKDAGRPIFTEMECVEIRFAGDRSKRLIFPAHEAEPNATRERGEVVTYAMLYSDQYRRFKSDDVQELSGTPISEAPFLSEPKRRELKALNIHTVEALASLDGHPLKQLGMGGREMKNQAQAYLDAAAGSADVTSMAATIAALQQQNKELIEHFNTYATKPAKTKFQKAVEKQVADQEPVEPEDEVDFSDVPMPTADEPLYSTPPDEKPLADPPVNVDPPKERNFGNYTDAELKAHIKEQSGEAVKGNPSRETLLRRATTGGK